MSWDSIAKNVATFAPAIGSAIGGPVGAVVGLGAKALCSFFGIDSEESGAQDKVDAALNSMTAEQAVLLKQADMAFQKEMKSLDVDVFKLEVDDRKSARERELKTSGWATGILGGLVVAGFGATVAAVLSGHVSMTDSILAGTLIGYVSAKADTVIGYYFGSSAGSSRKTDALVLGLQAPATKK